MDILYNDYCIKVTTEEERILHRSLNLKIYNKFKDFYKTTDLQYDCYDATLDYMKIKQYYGYFDNECRNGKESWNPIISLEEYKNQVYFIIDKVRYKNQIDNFSII